MKNIIIIIAVSITLSIVGCGKISDIINGDENPEQIAIYSDKYNVTPFETIRLTADDYTFSNDVYYATIADTDIELRKITDNQIMFMMPTISSGNQILTFDIDGLEYELEFIVSVLPIVPNPEEVITEYKQEISNMVDTIEYLNSISGLNVSEQNLQLIKNQLSEFEQANATATDAEKQELAQFMQLNPDLFDLSYFNFQILNDSLDIGTRDFVAWDKRLTRDMQYFTGLIITTGATIVIFNGTLYSGNPFLIGAATLALATEFILVFDQTETMLNRSYKPFELDILNEQKIAINIEFENDVQFMLGIDATYRTLYNNDEGSSSVIIDLVANINTFTGYWNTVVSYIPGLDGSVSNLDDQNAYKVNSTTAPITPQYVTIENISNSNVTISQFSNTDAVRVTFTTYVEEDQVFTFDLVYNNPDFSSETITVSAKVVVTTFDYAGVWLLRWYNTSDGVLFQDDRITFNANGESTFAEYNIYQNNQGWVTYQGETFTMSYSDGSLTIHDNYWGNTYYYTVNSVDDDIFIGTYPVSGWNQELHRQ